MRLFDLFRRRPAQPARLLDDLIAAAARQDWRTLTDLCRRHQQEIRESFPRWRTVPKPIRADPKAADRYCRALVAVAEIFEQGGDRSLIEAFLGNEADNPIMIWQRDLEAAQTMIDDGKPGEAIVLLQAALERAAGLQGTGVDHCLPRTFGMLGVACFRAGENAKAIEFTEKAKALCEQSGDQEGVATYEGNLEQMREGGRVIFRDADGRELTLEELQKATGMFRYEVLGTENVPPEAESLHRNARQAGCAGDYESALADLRRAAELAPAWPYPVYDMAFTYLLMRDDEMAKAFYRNTVELSPRGFFTAITALDTLEREAKGELPAGTCLAYVSLEWLDDSEKKSETIRQMVERVPSFAPAWKELALLLNGDEEKLAAIEKGLAAGPDPETEGILQINKALILNRKGRHDEAVDLLGRLAVDPASTFGTQHLAKATLADLPVN